MFVLPVALPKPKTVFGLFAGFLAFALLFEDYTAGLLPAQRWPA